MKKQFLAISLMFAGLCASAQTVRGTVTDAVTGEPLPYGVVRIKELPGIGSATDSIGAFQIKGITPGRYTVIAQYVGYQPEEIAEVMIVDNKETVLDFQLSETASQLKEVVIRPKIEKSQPLNKLATAGAHLLSMEEASRYAGAFEDPARLVTSFAGVASSPTGNGIFVHGNASEWMTWRIEGIEINAPNHFQDCLGPGTGIVGSLCSRVLANSDFFSGALTAEYGNSLSGCMDMKFKVGNNSKYESGVQIGTCGLEAYSEGPISKKHHSSYVFNYRYGLTGIANKAGLMKLIGSQYDYQDLNFKLNFPTKKAGTFYVWGLLGYGRSWVDETTFEDDIEGLSDLTLIEMKEYSVATGVGNRVNLGKGISLHTTLGFNYYRTDNNLASVGLNFNGNRLGLTGPFTYENWVDNPENFDCHKFTFSKSENNSSEYYQQKMYTTLHMVLNKKWKHGFTQFGFDAKEQNFDINLYNNNADIYAPVVKDLAHNIYDGSGNAFSFNPFVTNSWNISNDFTLNLGVASQYFSLNKKATVEPRAGFKWRVGDNDNIGGGYSLQSRQEDLSAYFYQENGNELNRNLSFAKTHHFMLNWTHKLSEDITLKAEAYYQYVWDLPVADENAFLASNPTAEEILMYNPIFTPSMRYENFIDQQLCNDGKARNYGIDLSIEQYMHKGWFWSVNGCLYKAEYKAQNTDWLESRWDRTYNAKAMVGHEWIWGAKKNNVLSASVKYTIQGGSRITPLNIAASQEVARQGITDVIYDYGDARHNNTFSIQTNPIHIVDFSVNYRLSGKHLNHVIACDFINIFQEEDAVCPEYNIYTKKANYWMFTFPLPNIYYRLEF